MKTISKVIGYVAFTALAGGLIFSFMKDFFDKGVNASQPKSVEIKDVNGDGRLDTIVRGYNVDTLYGDEKGYCLSLDSLKTLRVNQLEDSLTKNYSPRN